jgi:hypothetical protein
MVRVPIDDVTEVIPVVIFSDLICFRSRVEVNLCIITGQ